MVTGIGATAQQVAGTPATTQIPPAEPVKRSSDNRRVSFAANQTPKKKKDGDMTGATHTQGARTKDEMIQRGW